MMRSYRFPVSRPNFGSFEKRYLNEVLASGQLTQGPFVEAFEEMLAKNFGQHVVACSSGTAALHLALAAAGIGPGDEVLVPSMTYIASANAIAYTGATPVLVDVKHDSWTIDPHEIMHKASSRTAAIMPVHIYGVPADMAELRSFCVENDWILIEDSAEAFRSYLGDSQCGTMSDFGCFSFYGNKLITTGEGGCVVTPDAESAALLKKLRGQGQSKQRFVHDALGFNYRMTEMQAALGLGQLNRVEGFIEARESIFATYDAAFANAFANGMMFKQSMIGRHVVSPWLYTFLVSDKQTRDTLAAKLDEKDIETRPTFVPLHRQENYARPDVQFPVSSKIGDRGISIPTYVGLNDASYIADCVLAALKTTKQNAGGARCTEMA